MPALEEYENRTDKTQAEQCYDTASGKYLTRRQWIEQLLNARKRRGGLLKGPFKTGDWQPGGDSNRSLKRMRFLLFS
jgi:hypothetical protein